MSRRTPPTSQLRHTLRNAALIRLTTHPNQIWAFASPEFSKLVWNDS